MPVVMYRGMSEAEQAAYVETRIATMEPPERRGMEPWYHIDAQRDSERTREDKRKRTAEWIAARRKELDHDVRGMASAGSTFGLTFPAGQPVEVPETHEICQPEVDKKTRKVIGPSRLQMMINGGCYVLVDGAVPQEPVSPGSSGPRSPVVQTSRLPSEPPPAPADAVEKPEHGRRGRPRKEQ